MKLHKTVTLTVCGLCVAFTGCAASTDANDANAATGDPQNWEAESATEDALSTHLWITDHAIALLASRSDLPGATAMAAFMNEPACRAEWEQGLVDADFVAAYNNGVVDTRPGEGKTELVLSGATWKSHFYDPDTELNYKGQVDPTARTQAAEFLATAAADWSAGDAAHGCYHLGLAIHYVTDLTQPMHSSNFTATKRPFKLHTNLESYAMEIQDRFVVSDASGIGASTGSPDSVLVATAYASKALWPTTLSAIRAAYAGGSFACRAGGKTWILDAPSCWKDDASVDQQIGVALEAAQKATADYLYAARAQFVSAAN